MKNNSTNEKKNTSKPGLGGLVAVITAIKIMKEIAACKRH